MCLTNEQLRICNYEVTHGEVVKIVAFAGMSFVARLQIRICIKNYLKSLIIILVTTSFFSKISI